MSSGTDSVSLVQWVTFRLGEEEYAVDVAQVQEIVRLVAITPVPRAPAHVEGVINLRGRIVPVVDLAMRLGLPKRDRTTATRIIITQVGDRTVGMLVDAVSEVLRLPSSAIEGAPDLLKASLNHDFFTGVGKLEERLLILLDLPRVLSREDEAALAGVSAPMEG